MAILAGAGTDIAANALSTQLGRDHEIVLVRRQDQESGQEANNQKGSGKNGADGAIILSVENESEPERSLSVRLVATGPGVVLDSVSAAFPLANPDAWSKAVWQRFRGETPKLAVSPRNTIPVSILNIRAAIRSDKRETLAQELTNLFIERLAQTPSICVPERRALGKIAELRDSAGANHEQFSHGAYIVDGVIDRDGELPGVTTLSIRLQRPGQAKPVELNVTDASDDHRGLIDKAVGLIVDTVRENPSPPLWDSVREAEQYWNEGVWATMWSLPWEAAEAFESAWGLGKQTREVSIATIKAYTQPPGPGEADAADSDDVRANQIDRAIRALDLYESRSGTSGSVNYEKDSEWYGVGIEAIKKASEILKGGYIQPMFRGDISLQTTFPKDRTALARLRIRIREVSELMSMANAPASGSTATDELKTTWDGGENLMSIDALKARYASYWYETPEEAADSYRELLRGDHLTKPANRHSVRLTFFFCNTLGTRWESMGGGPAQTELVDWQGVGQEHLQHVWQNMLEAMCASTDLTERILGQVLEWRAKDDDREYLKGASATLDLIWQYRERIYSNDRDFDCVSTTYDWIADRLERVASTETENFSKNVFRPFQLRFLRAYLSAASTIDSNRILALAPHWFAYHNFYTDDDANQLLSMLGEAKGKIPGEARELDYYMRQLESSHPRATAAPSSTPTPAAGPSPSTQSPDKESLLVTHIWQSAPIVEKALSDAAEAEAESVAEIEAEIMGFEPEDAIDWYVPPAPVKFAPDRHPTIIALKYRENKIWAELRFGSDNDRQGAICNIDPATFQTNIVFFTPGHDPSWLNDVKGTFDVLDGDIYVRAGDHIEKYGTITKQWERLDTNAPCDEIEAIGGRLYLISTESLIEYDVKSGASTVLASGRRVPPQNILDGVRLYPTPHIFPGPGDSLRATAGSYVFEYNRAKRDWVRLGPQPAVWGRSQGIAFSTWKDGTVLYDPSTAFNRIIALGRDSENEQMLIEEWSPYQTPPPGEGLWQRPGDFPVGGSGATNGGKKGITYDGKTMNIFLGPIFRDQELRPNIGVGGMRRFRHGNMVLYHFTEPGKPAAEIPLWLTFGANARHPEKMPSLWPGPGEFLTLLVPGGTVITEKLRGDFWFIPDADIEKYVTDHRSANASL